MNEQAILSAYFQGHLTNGFDKRLALNITDGSTDFGNHYICIGFLSPHVDKMLNLIGNMRNDLNRLAKILALTLTIQNIPVNLTTGKIGVLIQILINKTLIMSQVQIRLRTVIGNENFSVLIWAHGSRVNVHVWI